VKRTQRIFRNFTLVILSCMYASIKAHVIWEPCASNSRINMPCWCCAVSPALFFTGGKHAWKSIWADGVSQLTDKRRLGMDYVDRSQLDFVMLQGGRETGDRIASSLLSRHTLTRIGCPLHLPALFNPGRPGLSHHPPLSLHCRCSLPPGPFYLFLVQFID